MTKHIHVTGGDFKTGRKPWFRFYTEALDDPKVQRLPPHLFKTWINLLCLAGQSDGVIPSIDDIAFRLRMSAQDAEGQLSDLILAGLIDITESGRTPHNWKQRQFVSDSSTSRVKKHRKIKSETQRNVSETVDETAPEQSRADSEQIQKREEPPLPPKGAPAVEPIDCLQAFEAYNAVALRCGLPQASRLTPGRAKLIKARLREHGMDGWSQALANIEKSSFLTGGNDRGFRADLDFVLQAKSFSRLHDGGYGNGRHASKPQTPRVRNQDLVQTPEVDRWIRENCL